MYIGTRTPHVSLTNIEQLIGGKKTIFQYWPDMCCMCLLRGLNGHIRVIYLTSRSRLSVSSWPPKLPSSSPDAHWPPIRAWHLGYIRIALAGGVHPLAAGAICRLPFRREPAVDMSPQGPGK
jgi:hypothetical protein